MGDSNTFRKRGRDYSLREGMRTLPGKYYHSQEIYEEELQKIFCEKWLLAGRDEEIPEAGDYKLLEVGDESLIIVRTKSGGVVANFNVCRHRGTRLCVEASGHFESKNIQCPYHAWTYDLDGQLIASPMMQSLESFDKEAHHLHQASIHEWGGFIFVNLSRDPISFEEEMAPLLGRFKNWNLSELRSAHTIEYEVKCNWKLILQNYQECYHCPGVHPLLSKHTPYKSAQHDCVEGAVIGGFMELENDVKSMTMDGEPAGPPVGEVKGEDLRRVYYYSVFPNMLLTPHPDFVLFHHIMPRGNGAIINTCHWLFHPDVLANPNYKDSVQSAIDFWDLTNREDWAVCEQMQMGTKSRRFTRGTYSGQEDLLYALDQELLRILGHESPE